MKTLLALIALAVIVTAPVAVLAQEEGHDHDPYADPTAAPMIVPTTSDFAPPADDPGVMPDRGDMGLSSYIEFSDTQKSGLLTPYYHLTPMLVLKARVPLILSKTVNFWGTEGKASGLGDVTVAAEYTKFLGDGAVFGFEGSVKLPTGDEEKEDNGIAVPLGTGTMDFFGKARYAKAAPDFDWVGSVVFRRNSGYDYEPSWDNLAVITNTSGNQIIGSVFARKRAGDKWWLHLGASANMISDGSSKTEYSDGRDTIESDVESGGTVIDLYPGVSYALGKLNPFLGVRLPISTSWNNEFASDERDMAFIFQFTYRPERMGG